MTPAARGVTVEWFSFSLVPLFSFILEVTEEEASNSTTVTVILSMNETVYTIESLRPFSAHIMSLTAENRAGDTTRVLNFTTLQDSRFSSACTHHMTFTLDPTAPDAPPTNVVAVTVDTNSIHLSWAAPPPDTWNGVITHYVINYYSLTNLSSSVNLTTNETEALLDDLDPDTTYQFTVAAETVGLGPSSAPVVQRTYPLPPPLDSVPLTLPMIPMVSMTTIPVLLPPVNSSLFRYTHYHRRVV